MDVLVTNNPWHRIHGDGNTSSIPAASASDVASKSLSQKRKNHSGAAFRAKMPREARQCWSLSRHLRAPPSPERGTAYQASGALE
jgi:hypothetical protein